MLNNTSLLIKNNANYLLRRGIYIFFFFAMSIFSSISNAHGATPDTTLATTDIFSIGLIGFIGHISEGELAYREILASNEAETRFWIIYSSDSSTTAAKLYCACALKELISPMFQEIKQRIKISNEKVTTMKGDIMRKEDVSEIIERIDLFGC